MFTFVLKEDVAYGINLFVIIDFITPTLTLLKNHNSNRVLFFPFDLVTANALENIKIAKNRRDYKINNYYNN